jgi:hypothetical protein
MEIEQMPPEEGGFYRQFIPALLSDNPSIDQSAYSNALKGLGNEALVRAMLDGNWDVVAGAALNVDRARHAIRPFRPLRHWTKFQVLDWGYVHPFSCGWYCVVDEPTLIAAKDGYPDVYLPKGALVRYREYYGWNGKPNQGARLESQIVAKNILAQERSANERMDYRVADTQIWAKNDGKSIFDNMYEATNGEYIPIKSLKDRQANYNEICMRLRGEEQPNGSYTPMFYVTENCLQWWRTVPPLVLDDLHPEKGPDEGQENHAYDEMAYALMSHPYITTQTQRLDNQSKRLRKRIKNVNTDPYRIKPVMSKQ